MKLAVLAGFLFIIVQIFYTDARRKVASSSIRRGSGSSSSTGSRYPSKPTSQPSNGGSQPGTIGWNVPKQSVPVNKASAPINEHVAKTSATNVQSSNWKPSGGYNTQTGVPHAQNSGGYNQHSSYPSSSGNQQSAYPGSHNPYGPSHLPGSYNNHGTSGGYHPQSGNYGGYGSHTAAGAPPPYTPYNPYSSSYGHSYTPGAGYNPPVGHAPQTILVQGSSRPGIGQLAKEALVFAGVSAGVNAVANRIIPGGIYGGHGHSSSSGGAANVPAVTHTQITYNNYYNNGTVPANETPVAPAGVSSNSAAPNPAMPNTVSPTAGNSEPSPVVPIDAANNNRNPSNPPAATGGADVGNPQTSPVNEESNFPSPTGQIITKADIQKLTNDLFEKETNNAFKYITMNLQGQKTDDSTTDNAPELLLSVKDEAYQMPIVKAVLALHDNYELDVKDKETVLPEERKEEGDLIDLLVDSEILKVTIKFLVDKGYVPNDEYEFKDTLKRIWFSQFKRIDGDPGSSGFETVFLAEKFNDEIIGMHNWIYYAKQEENKNLNYLGYIKQSSLGDKGSIVKLRSILNGIIQPVTTIFVGTSPELEIALYTMCFYTRPNYPCPIKLGTNEFIIIANRVNYFGKDILVSAYPEI